MQREVRATESLVLHPAVEDFFKQTVGGGHLSALPATGSVAILPDGTVVRGAGVILKTRRVRLSVLVRPDLADEDAAVAAAAAVKDALAGTHDPLVVGCGWVAFNRFCKAAGRPRKGYRHARYVRRYGVRAAERFRQLTHEVFGLRADQLRRRAKLLALPPVLQDAARRGAVAIKALAELADRPRAVVEAVAAAIEGGQPPALAVAANTAPEKSVPAARTWVRRLLRVLTDADGGLAGRLPEVMCLDDIERAGCEAGRRLLDGLLTLPTRGEALAAVLGTYTTGRTVG